MRKMLLMMLLVICTLSINAQSASNKDATIVSDIQYKSNQDAYVNERCKLDIYYSKGQKDCPVVVWYHGGGLTSGSKQLPSQLMSRAIPLWGSIIASSLLLPSTSAWTTVLPPWHGYSRTSRSIMEAARKSLFQATLPVDTSRRCLDWTRNG